MKSKEAGEWWKNHKKRRGVNYYGALYENLKFNIRNPILEIGGGSVTFLKFLGINDATIFDIGGENNLVGNYKFIRADITRRLPGFKKNLKLFL